MKKVNYFSDKLINCVPLLKGIFVNQRSTQLKGFADPGYLFELVSVLDDCKHNQSRKRFQARLQENSSTNGTSPQINQF